MNPGACRLLSVKGGLLRLRTPNPRLSIKGVAVPGTERGNYISGAPDVQCTFWHLEIVMKKVAVVLRHSKKPLRQGKKKPAV